MVFCRSANVARLPGVCEAASGFVYSCCLLPAALFLGLAAAALGAEMPEAVPVDGKPFRAELVGADARWQLTFKAGDKPRVVPGAELVRWGTPAEAHRGPVLVLADGGRLPAAVLGAEKGTLLADSFRLVPDDAAAQGLKLPLESLAGVVFRLPADHHQRDLLLDRVASASGESDRLILTGGDEIAATVRAIDEGTIHLVTDVGPVDVELYRARALVFNPALRRRPQQDPKGLHAWAGFRDGTQLRVAGMTLDEKSLRVTCRLFLKALGYTVLAAQAPAEALTLAAEHTGEIDLLITDVVMPGMNGRDLADRLRTAKPGLRCLFMSGYTADVIAHRGILEADVPFLSKPFTRDDLAHKVRDVLEAAVPGRGAASGVP